MWVISLLISKHTKDPPPKNLYSKAATFNYTSSKKFVFPVKFELIHGTLFIMTNSLINISMRLLCYFDVLRYLYIALAVLELTKINQYIYLCLLFLN